jgi:hypothetical protein
MALEAFVGQRFGNRAEKPAVRQGRHRRRPRVRFDAPVGGQRYQANKLSSHALLDRRASLRKRWTIGIWHRPPIGRPLRFSRCATPLKQLIAQPGLIAEGGSGAERCWTPVTRSSLGIWRDSL